MAQHFNPSFLLPFPAITLCSPIDGVARIFLFSFLLSGKARSRHLSCLVPSFTYHLRPERENNHLNIVTRQCWRRESNPGRQHSKRERYPLHHCPPAMLVNNLVYQVKFLEDVTDFCVPLWNCSLGFCLLLLPYWAHWLTFYLSKGIIKYNLNRPTRQFPLLAERKVLWTYGIPVNCSWLLTAKHETCSGKLS